MKILLLGGTGAIGAHLKDILANGNNQVFVTTRAQRESRDNVTYIQGNAHNDSFITNVLKEHFDAIVDFMSYKTEEFRKRNELYLKNTEQYIFLSSARVYADAGNNLITEDTPRLIDVCDDSSYLETDEYALTKARQEDLLFKSKYKNWTIIRPYITYSENRLQLGVLEKEAWLFRAINGHAIVFSDDIIDNITTLTYGLDVSKSMAALIGNKKSYGKVFHITGEDYCSWREILRTYKETIESELKKPVRIVIQNKSIRCRFNDTKYQVLYDRSYNRRFDNSNIADYVDINSFVSIKEGLEMCMKAFLTKPSFNQINIKEQALLDRVSREVYRRGVFQDNKSYFIYLVYRFVFGVEFLDILKQKIMNLNILKK